MSEDLAGHGPEDAFYSSRGDAYKPSITCRCGWMGREPTWTDAGQAFDDHLDDVKKGKG